MNINQFNIKLEELEIESSSIFDLMGYGNQEIPNQITEVYKSEMASFNSTADICGGYKLFSCEQINSTDQEIKLEHLNFRVGKQVCRLMSGSESLAIFACTAGKTISNRAKELMNNDDILEGYVVDVIGSVVVEKAMDLIHGKIKNEFSAKSLGISNRYSPGYCDWHVEEQHKLFSLLPQNFCNISLSKSALMQPIKSVSGIIGIGTAVKFNNYTCNICTQQKCIYRNKSTERISG